MNPGVALFALLLMIPPVAFMVWPLAALVKMMSARGTRQRYVASTFERAFRYPYLIGQLVLAGLEAKDHDWAGMGLTVVAVALAAIIINQFGSDDDDFWTGMKKKLQKRLPQFNFAPGAA
ncbi:hypothetical protein AB3M81_07570 [Aeromicrobium sp. 179-A 4D2 NHS]